LRIAIPGLNSSSLAATAIAARQSADQAAEGLLKLYPGELSAEAVMYAGAEGQAAGCVADDVKPVRIAAAP
jgi:hypothetical protein